MSYEYQSVETLIEGIKGTTGFFSGPIIRKSGMAVLLIMLGVIVSKILFS